MRRMKRPKLVKHGEMFSISPRHPPPLPTIPERNQRRNRANAFNDKANVILLKLPSLERLTFRKLLRTFEREIRFRNLYPLFTIKKKKKVRARIQFVTWPYYLRKETFPNDSKYATTRYGFVFPRGIVDDGTRVAESPIGPDRSLSRFVRERRASGLA